MCREIKIGAVSQAVEFFAAERKFEFEIDRAFRIMRAIFRCDLKFVHFGSRNADRFVECMYVLPPHLKSLFPFVRTNKIFDLHLFEFARAERKIARRDLVAERFPYLRNTERKFRMEGINDIFEINEYAAGRFGAKIRFRSISRCTYGSPEHHVELL